MKEKHFNVFFSCNTLLNKESLDKANTKGLLEETAPLEHIVRTPLLQIEIFIHLAMHH